MNRANDRAKHRRSSPVSKQLRRIRVRRVLSQESAVADAGGCVDPGLLNAIAALDRLEGVDPRMPLVNESGAPLSTWRELVAAARKATAAYRTAAGFASRKHVRKEDAASVRSRLFRARTAIEGAIEA